MLEAIEVINDIHPACFGIVDTYGAMYKGDVLRLFTLVHNNLAEDIAIDFHSHNNLQLSFLLRAGNRRGKRREARGCD